MLGTHSIRLIFLSAVLSSGMALGALVTPQPNSIYGRTNQQEDSTHSTEQQEFEPLFTDWSDPAVALFISGRQDGYLEPCGCTGLDNQLGGMMRRHTFLKQLKARGWNVVAIDTGNQVRRFGRQANLKLGTTYRSMAEDLQCGAVGFGPKDLALPTIELIQAMANSGLPSENFVCANVTVFDDTLSSRYRVIEENGHKIGLTMVLGDEHLEPLRSVPDLTVKSVDQAMGEVVPALQNEDCNFRVLVAYTSLEASRRLAATYDDFDLLICCGVNGEPTMRPEPVRHPRSEHVTQLIQTGHKGMHVGVVGIFPAESGLQMRYQRVPLDHRFEDSEPIKAKFLSYQKQMEALGLEGLEIRPVAHPSGRKYVGSEVCFDCHDLAYDIWKDGVDGEGGPHARATLDLVEPGERTWVKRHHDPECLSCHVTGWNPQEFFPYESGYLKIEDEWLHGNGCENCHGPASMHVAAENGDIDVTEAQRERFYKEMVVTLEQARQELCISCHDLDNSPDFHEEGAFEEYWEKIKH